MKKIKDFIALLSGFRKLLFAFLGLVLIVSLCLIVLSVFIINWKLGTSVITGQQLTDLFIASFKYSAMIVGSYMASNVVVKGIREWLAKKK